MKKLLLVILCISLFACSKSVSWEDVSEKFVEVAEKAGNPYQESEVFLSRDYIKIINRIKDNIAVMEDENEETLLRIYEDAGVLEKCVSVFDSDQAAYINEFVDRIKEYVRSFYDKTIDRTALQQQIDQMSETILSWSEEDWIGIEKRKLISWAEVQSEYEQLKQDALENMTAPKQVSEIELQEYNDMIVVNYELISNGINDANRDIADEMYKAAVILKEYTSGIKNNSCEKVAALADDTITYIMSKYGAETEDEDYDFINRVQTAARWSLSLWNEVTAQLKR